MPNVLLDPRARFNAPTLRIHKPTHARSNARTHTFTHACTHAMCLGADGPLLLDCREEDEYAFCRVEGSVLIPMSQMQVRFTPHFFC